MAEAGTTIKTNARTTGSHSQPTSVTLLLPADVTAKIDALRANLEPAPSRAEAVLELLRIPLREASDNPKQFDPAGVSGQLGPQAVKKQHMPSYPRAVLIGLDVLCNAISGGRPYQTMSCRVGESIMENGWAARIPWSRAWINHCLASVHEEIV